MKQVFGYIRVSTVRQGEGVSLAEQKEAIERYALKNNLGIAEWFEETKTAAKEGRPLFSEMLKKLRKGVASGVIIHKIDRSARNLRDWNEIIELKERGVEVYFAHESLDLNERSGRLSADILAVVASDFIRNQRQEVIKGLYGRLKQGIYPWPAPVGYLNNGKAKVKTVDPIQGPLVAKAFELYATRKHSLERLLPVMERLGLRTIKGHKMYINSLSLMLKNPFYIGLIKVKGQTFKGNHEPLISPALFNRAQEVFVAKNNAKVRRHRLLFSKRIRCGYCNRSLIGEIHKGHVYYRCHTSGCLTKGIRESGILERIQEIFSAVQLHPEEDIKLEELLAQHTLEWKTKKQDLARSCQLQLAQTREKVDRLTDAYLDQILDPETFSRKKEVYLKQILLHEQQLVSLMSENDGILSKVKKFLELSKSLTASFKIGNFEEKLRLVETVTSNCTAKGKELYIPIYFPFSNLFFNSSSYRVHRAEKEVEPHHWQISEPMPDGGRTVTASLSEDAPRGRKRKRMGKKGLETFFDSLVEHYQRSGPG